MYQGTKVIYQWNHTTLGWLLTQLSWSGMGTGLPGDRME